jgi:hypothetical protein
MALDRPPLKQFGRLRRIDFDRAPVWVACHTMDYGEPWYDDTNEETFRPWTGATPFDAALGMAVVRAEFVLADATVLPGFVTPVHSRPPERPLANLPIVADLQPHVFGKGGTQLGFWSGIMVPTEADKRRFYRLIGREPFAVFPLRFGALPGLSTGTCSGVLGGFCFAPDLKTAVFEK